jgi:proton-translocating NADH-quinone oxidoreductase chain N
MNLMAGANDLVVIALSLEFLSLSSYILVGFLRGDPLSTEGALKYFLYGSIAGAVMLFGFSMLYGTAGTTSVPAIAAVLGAPDSILVGNVAALAVPALLLVLVGIGFKVAVVPFHQWSPDAYHGAPTPVTSFLAVGPKLAGFAVLMRLLTTAFDAPTLREPWVAALTAIAVLTMAFGNIVALAQTNVKRMMAYSSIAQAGYVMVGVVAAGTAADPAAALGAVLLFLLAYLFTSVGAFAVIIAVDDSARSSELSAYAGLMHRAPLLGAALAVFFLSLVGIPPLGGFIGKFAVFRSAVTAGQAGLALVGVLTGVISVGYYFRVLRRAFFEAAPEDAPPLRVAPHLRMVIVVSLVMTFLIGIYAEPFVRLAADAAAMTRRTYGPACMGVALSGARPKNARRRTRK